jgi:putative endonuclease
MSLWSRLLATFNKAPTPEHLRRGKLGEHSARTFLEDSGLRFLFSNFRSSHGEIDLIMRDHDCIAFIEVKARSREDWTRPAAAVNRKRQRRLSRAALDYLRRIHNPEIKFRFDIVEVLLSNGAIREVRHLPNAFPLAAPYRYH